MRTYSEIAAFSSGDGVPFLRHFVGYDGDLYRFRYKAEAIELNFVDRVRAVVGGCVC